MMFLIFVPGYVIANVVWPAIYVYDSHTRFWYLAFLTVIVEAYAIHYFLKCSYKKAFIISFAANILSATVGIYLLTIGMMGWHFIADRIVHGTFHIFNKIATLVLMLFLSVAFESLFVKIIWKYKIRETFISLMIGNFISYTIIALDLFVFGGWHRTF
jgi:hypothetical protein